MYMQNKLDNIIQELKELSGNSRLNIELPDDIFISAYERKIGFIFPKDYKKVNRTGFVGDFLFKLGHLT